MKGISPMVGLTIVIGVIAGIGLIFYAWSSGMFKLQSKQVMGSSQQLITCMGGDFKLQWQQCQLTKGLAGLWHVDEGSGTTVTDSSGNDNTGTLYNGSVSCANPPTVGAGCPEWVDGKLGKGVNFDGIDDYLSIENSNILNPTHITVLAWIKPNAFNSVILSKNYTEYELRTDATGFVQFYVNNTYVNSSISLTTGNWHFLVGRYDGSMIKIFIDGVEKGSISYSLGIPSNLLNLLIANRPGGNSYFNGTIDEVRIYNRALSPEEIKALYYDGLNDAFNVSFTMFYTGVQAPNIGKDFTAHILLKNGTVIDEPFSLSQPLGVDNAQTDISLPVAGYYPSYGEISKVVVCSKACPGICAELQTGEC